MKNLKKLNWLEIILATLTALFLLNGIIHAIINLS